MKLLDELRDIIEEGGGRWPENRFDKLRAAIENDRKRFNKDVDIRIMIWLGKRGERPVSCARIGYSIEANTETVRNHIRKLIAAGRLERTRTRQRGPHAPFSYRVIR